MSKEDLIPLGQPGNEEHDRKVRAKLKGSGSQKRKTSQQIRWIKQMSPETIEKKALQLIANPEASSLEIMKLIQVLLHTPDMNTQTLGEIVDKLIRAHTAIHGNKSKNFNLNVDSTISEVIKRLEESKEPK